MKGGLYETGVYMYMMHIPVSPLAFRNYGPCLSDLGPPRLPELNLRMLILSLFIKVINAVSYLNTTLSFSLPVAFRKAKAKVINCQTSRFDKYYRNLN